MIRLSRFVLSSLRNRKPQNSEADTFIIGATATLLERNIIA